MGATPESCRNFVTSHMLRSLPKCVSRDYAALWRLRGIGRRLRVIFFFLACRRTRCAVSGGEPEGGVEKVCVLTGGVRRSGCSRPVFQVTRRGMRASARRKMS
jgi:hypothetical protein